MEEFQALDQSRNGILYLPTLFIPSSLSQHEHPDFFLFFISYFMNGESLFCLLVKGLFNTWK